MKNGTLLRRVINKLNEIDFTSASERHLFGDIYEQILKDLQSAGNAGEFYTPRAVTRFMVDRVDPKLGESIMDPACGTGGFLACAFDHVKQLREERGRSPDAATADPRRGEKQLPHLRRPPICCCTASKCRCKSATTTPSTSRCRRGMNSWM